MLASHWVVEDVLKAIESKDSKEIKETLKKFVSKYPEDKEIVNYAKGYLKSRDSKLLKEMKARLKALMEERKMEGAGGSQLWFGDRRGRGEQTLR
jgi:uncharacterized C2H2 Zn-finger protein